MLLIPPPSTPYRSSWDRDLGTSIDPGKWNKAWSAIAKCSFNTTMYSSLFPHLSGNLLAPLVSLWYAFRFRQTRPSGLGKQCRPTTPSVRLVNWYFVSLKMFSCTRHYSCLYALFSVHCCITPVWVVSCLATFMWNNKNYCTRKK